MSWWRSDSVFGNDHLKQEGPLDEAKADAAEEDKRAEAMPN